MRPGPSRWVQATIGETVEESFRQERRGRPGTNTRYRRHTRTRHTISWNLDPDRIAYDAAADGCFPLISNDTTLTDAELLAAYRYQPNLERRHHLLKSVQDAAPVLLHNPARIEALFCCQFLALLIGALIERQIRTAMAAAHAADIPLYPEFRGCAGCWPIRRGLSRSPASSGRRSSATTRVLIGAPCDHHVVGPANHVG